MFDEVGNGRLKSNRTANRPAKSAMDQQPAQQPASVLLPAAAMLAGLFLIVLFTLPYLSQGTADYSVSVRAQVVESATLPAESLLDRIWPRHRFVYRYVYQGEVYASSVYRHGSGRTEAVRRYSVGSMLTARLDPNQPERAVVETGLRLQDMVIFALGLILLLGGIVRLFDWPGPWQAGRGRK